MGYYLFQHPETEEVVEVFQRMNEDHLYISEDGTMWNRIYVNPKVSIDTKIDPYSSRDFVEKTKNKNGTIGDLWDRSAELSERRAKIEGSDSIKDKAANSYKDKTGKEHPHAKPDFDIFS